MLQVLGLRTASQNFRGPTYPLRLEYRNRRLRSGYETNEKASQYQGRKATQRYTGFRFRVLN
jgi:hypothetical protein